MGTQAARPAARVLTTIFGDRLPDLLQFLQDVGYIGLDEFDRRYFLEASKIENPEARWQSILADVRWQQLFFVLFGFRYTGRGKTAIEDLVIGDIKLLLDLLASRKEIYKCSDYHAIWKKTTCIDAIMENPAVGKMQVTTHAWQRYCERTSFATEYCKPLISGFNLAFQRAAHVRKGTGNPACRLMNNNFIPVHYLAYSNERIRFICDARQYRNGEVAPILTVERMI